MSFRSVFSVSSRAGPSRLPLPLTRPSSHHLSPVCPLRRPFSTTLPCPSGHSKWSKIRHKKGAADRARSAIFSRLSQDVQKQLLIPGASFDPSSNRGLAAAMQKAQAGGMQKATIEAIIERAKKRAEGGQLGTYELMGQGGKEAVIVEVMTDNPRRFGLQLKEITSKHFRMSPVGFLFERKGSITVAPTTSSSKTFDDLFELAAENGAEDVEDVSSDGQTIWEIAVSPTTYGSLLKILSEQHASDYTIEDSEMAYVPMETIEDISAAGLTEEGVQHFWKGIERIEQLPEVEHVWTNLVREEAE